MLARHMQLWETIQDIGVGGLCHLVGRYDQNRRAGIAIVFTVVLHNNQLQTLGGIQESFCLSVSLGGSSGLG